MEKYELFAQNIAAPIEYKEKAMDYAALVKSHLDELVKMTNGQVELDLDDIYSAFLNGIVTGVAIAEKGRLD